MLVYQRAIFDEYLLSLVGANRLGATRSNDETPATPQGKVAFSGDMAFRWNFYGISMEYLWDMMVFNGHDSGT